MQPSRRPNGEVEQGVARIWVDVIRVGRVGRQDDFFALGGHSLLAVKVISRLRESAGVEIPLETLFRHPTLAGFSHAVATASREDTGRIPCRSGGAEVVSSFAQRRLWLLTRMERASRAYPHRPQAGRSRGHLMSPR